MNNAPTQNCPGAGRTVRLVGGPGGGMLVKVNANHVGSTLRLPLWIGARFNEGTVVTTDITNLGNPHVYTISGIIALYQN